jgi:hypothetical protein
MKTSIRKTARRFFVSGLTLFLMAAYLPLKAQTGKTDFSGTWAFNEAKSTVSQGGFRFAPVKMVIKQDGINLTVDKTSVRQGGEEFTSSDKFTLDGKECTNPAFNSSRKSMVKWSEDGLTLAFSHTMSFERDGQTNEFKSSETWKYNSADKTLTVETSFNGPNGEMKTTNVYDKK